MKDKKEQISSFALLFTIVCFVQSSALLIGYVSSITEQDTWFVTLIGFILTLPIIWLYISLSSKFPGKSIIEINDIVFGKIVGKIFSIFYLFFFFSLSFLNSNNAEEFIVGSLMPETPKLVIAIMFVSVCCYAAHKGIETITRYSVLFVFLVFCVMIANFILLVKDIKFNNFQPMFSLPFMKYIQGTHTQIILPFSEIMIFFMLFPNLKKPKDIKKPLFFGLAIGAFTFFVIVARDTAVMGNLITYMSNPAYDTVRLIDFGDVFTRLEFFYVVLLLVLIFFKVSIIIYAVVKSIQQIFTLSTYKTLIPVIGVLIIIFSLIAFDSDIDASYWGVNVATVYSTFFELILPLITFIIASMRGFKKVVEVK